MDMMRMGFGGWPPPVFVRIGCGGIMAAMAAEEVGGGGGGG